MNYYYVRSNRYGCQKVFANSISEALRMYLQTVLADGATYQFIHNPCEIKSYHRLFGVVISSSYVAPMLIRFEPIKIFVI